MKNKWDFFLVLMKPNFVTTSTADPFQNMFSKQKHFTKVSLLKVGPASYLLHSFSNNYYKVVSFYTTECFLCNITFELKSLLLSLLCIK